MSRLFVSPRDLQFISDVTKELLRDVVGAKVYYYRVLPELAEVDEVYGDAKELIYDDPVEVNVFVTLSNQEVKAGKWGKERYRELTLFFSYEDLLDQDIDPSDGDVIAWGDHFYEILDREEEKEVWGAVEFQIGLKVSATEVQSGTIEAVPPKPLGKRNIDVDAEDGAGWSQDRGKEHRANGQPTGDRRDLIKKDQTDEPRTQMRTSPAGEPERQRSQGNFHDSATNEEYDPYK